MLPERIACAFEAGQDAPDFPPEIAAVIHFAQVCDFVHDDIVDDISIEMNQAPVKHDVAVAVAGSPAGGRRRQSPAVYGQPADFLEMVHPQTEPDPGLLLQRSEEHTSELPSLLRLSYAVFCLKKKTDTKYS